MCGIAAGGYCRHASSEHDEEKGESSKINQDSDLLGIGQSS